MTDVDINYTDILAELDRTLHQAGIELCFAEMKKPVKDRLKQYGLFSTLGTDNFYPTNEQAVEHYLTVDHVHWNDCEKGRPDQKGKTVESRKGRCG